MTSRSKVILGFVVTVGVVFALAGSPSASAVEVDSAFTDDDWSIHETAINAIAAAGITKGCNPPLNSRFCPLRSVTRGEMAAFIVRAFKLAGPATAPFVDTTGHLFEADIAKLESNGITVGCGQPSALTFCPDNPVSRAEMATFLLRVLGLDPLDDGPFVDVAETVHRTSVNALAAEGITKGCNPPVNDEFCPSQAVTRAEMATFLVRSLDLPGVLNRLAIRESSICNEELTVCTSTATIPAGRSFTVSEGWFQVSPATADERHAFESTTTGFALTLDGVSIGAVLVTSGDPSQTQRSWESTVDDLAPGVHTLVGTWTWDGDVNLTTTVTITSN